MFKESRLLYETIESKSPLERLRILNSLESIYFKSPIEKRSVGKPRDYRDNTRADNDKVDEVVSRKIHDYETSQVLVNQLKDIHKQIDHKTKTTGRTDIRDSLHEQHRRTLKRFHDCVESGPANLDRFMAIEESLRAIQETLQDIQLQLARQNDISKTHED